MRRRDLLKFILPADIDVRLDLLLLFLSFHLTDSLLYVRKYTISFVLSRSSSIIIGMNELRKRDCARSTVE